ncbi:hypothetical protein THAOC_00184 [Thalassiosira oceanica]|uniref:Uncharacterized protein n=1 Tax=Thalassiosira oceanica TaxID=159749 RepID=K0TGR4_THAOC|nr:hypothetical protein THAOC_00184 [Thalassiosira oceanica]|eukprot:EJK77948.1 hypothetical protein THAOC_00184 [Thalassiosira oceanica]
MEDIDRDGPIPCRTFDLDSKLHGESDKPFDVSFQPAPMLSATAPACPFGTVGIDVVIPSTPQLSTPHNSIDVIEKTSANAEVHHQSYERQKSMGTDRRATQSSENYYQRATYSSRLQSMATVVSGPWLDDSCLATDPVGH